jgi:hypothetical protein
MRRTANATVLIAMLVGVLAGFAVAARTAEPEFPDGCWGVYSWCSWNPRTITREKCPDLVGAPIIMHWRSLEPAEGDYRFEQLLGERLRLAKENGFRVFTMIWVGPFSPAWIYDVGVPKVMTDRKGWTFPYYFDEDYVSRFHKLIRKFGEYIHALPEDLRDLIVFVQVCEGSTGDGGCYKGRPTDKRYAIPWDEWRKFRVKTWGLFKEVFQEGVRRPVPLLVNNDANRAEEHAWLMKNLGAIGCKQGMFSHGYHINDAVNRMARWREFVAKAEGAGKTIFTRGEMDAEWQRSGWSRKNPAQALYWSALYATHCGLDLWNVPGNACQGDTYAAAIRFFNKYAGRRDAATSPGAFSALRRGLDASDVETFPVAKYGKAHRRSVDRYVKIAAAFAERGAKQGDPRASTGGGMANRGRKDYNDVGWGILRGNYGRFLEQIDPDKTSVGWWHAGPAEHVYSRFARGFDRASGRAAMGFKLHERFFADRKAPHTARVRVVYLDRGKGRWALTYRGRRGEEKAFTVECGNSGKWLEKRAVIEGAYFSGGLARGADLVLKHIGGDDTLFHMIELERK